jgi:phytoene synthase
LYLPLQWLRDVQIDPDEWLARPVFNHGISAVIERLLAAAELLYARSDSGIARLPTACRPGMYAARLLYCEIGREVSRRNFDSVGQRAVVSWQRKARILADAALTAVRAQAVPTVEVLEEARFLLEALSGARAAAAADPADSPHEIARRPRVEDRVAWLVDLFERLERRDRALQQAANPS